MENNQVPAAPLKWFGGDIFKGVNKPEIKNVFQEDEDGLDNDEQEDILQDPKFETREDERNPGLRREVDRLGDALGSTAGYITGYPGSWADVKRNGKLITRLDFSRFYPQTKFGKLAFDFVYQEAFDEKRKAQIEFKKDHCRRKQLPYAVIVVGDADPSIEDCLEAILKTVPKEKRS